MTETDQTEQAPETVPDDDWEDELIPNHEYDGIKEYDNPIPGWLSLLFWGTIVWSLFYVVAINLGYIDTFKESFQEGRAEIERKRAAAEQNQTKVDAEMLAEAVENEERVKAGKAIYSGNCVACHKENGGGDVGPNLTDDYWIHGGKLTDIYETLVNGVTDKGMPAWEGRLSQKEIVSVVAYIRSLRGTNPPDAKEKEGEKYVPE